MDSMPSGTELKTNELPTHSKCSISSKKSLTVVSSPLKEEIELTWIIQEFKMVMKAAQRRKSFGKTGLIFPVGSASLGQKTYPDLFFEWHLKLEEKASVAEGGKFSFVGLRLRKVDFDGDDASDSSVDTEERIPEDDVDVWILMEGSVEVNGKRKKFQGTRLTDFFGRSSSRGWDELFKCSEVDELLDANGALTLKLKVVVYRALLDIGNIVKVETQESPSETISKAVASLLGDRATSDVSILVDGEASFCHKAILSARSPVFRAMFASESKENKEGVVVVTDVQFDVMEQFLTFLYTGKFHRKRKRGSEAYSWVEMLPQLVYVADKYDLKDMKEFCDRNFHHALTDRNALEMVKFVKTHGLQNAEMNLKAILSTKFDNLFESLGE